MAENSNISWTDHTFNGWHGCTKVSPGCTHCYAETLSHRWGKDIWGKGKPRVRTSAANWKQPLKWNREASDMHACPRCGWKARCNPVFPGHCFMCGQSDGVLLLPARARVFSASMSDWLDDEVPIEWLADLLALIHGTPNLDWQLLTKRPENWRERLVSALKFSAKSTDEARFPITFIVWLQSWLDDGSPVPPANVWIGTTVEDQARADERIPKLLEIPARVRFLSCEPLLSAVEIPMWLKAKFGKADFNEFGKLVTVEEPEQKISWVIVGGESGHGCRPMQIEWAESIAAQCSAAGVPLFVKQDSGARSGLQGRLPDALWARKEFPRG